MTKLTNETLGPKAIMTTDRGYVTLAAGETADLNVSDADLAAIREHKLLEKAASVTGPSIADLQREVASTLGATPAEAATGTADDLPAADDPDVVAMVDANTADQLRELAKDSGADMDGARNKTEAARRIVAAQRAAGPAPVATPEEQAKALQDGNDADALRKIAADENVELADGDDEAAIAAKIVAARAAK